VFLAWRWATAYTGRPGSGAEASWRRGIAPLEFHFDNGDFSFPINAGTKWESVEMVVEKATFSAAS
jgi:hypothetical protein